MAIRAHHDMPMDVYVLSHQEKRGTLCVMVRAESEIGTSFMTHRPLIICLYVLMPTNFIHIIHQTLHFLSIIAKMGFLYFFFFFYYFGMISPASIL